MRKLYCRNPHQKVVVPDDCTRAFEIDLNKLVEAEMGTNTVADVMLEQYKGFLSLIGKEISEDFNECKGRTGTFFVQVPQR